MFGRKAGCLTEGCVFRQKPGGVGCLTEGWVFRQKPEGVGCLTEGWVFRQKAFFLACCWVFTEGWGRLNCLPVLHV